MYKNKVGNNKLTEKDIAVQFTENKSAGYNNDLTIGLPATVATDDLSAGYCSQWRPVSRLL